MSEGKQRSGIFKFFYIVLSIITFPIFVILFILRHPFWILFLLCLAAGGAAYYPISQGVKPEEVISWYQKKYQDIKFEVVTNAVESGKTDLIPQAIVDEVVKTKQKMEEEKAEAARPKSENYNENISRDKKVEEVKIDLKKRKGGFKKKVATENEKEVDGTFENVSDQKNDEITLDVKTLSAGGLAGVLSEASDENTQQQNVPAPVVQERDENIFGPTFTEKNDEEVREQLEALPQKEDIQAKSEKKEEKALSRDENVVIPQLPSEEKAIPSLLPNKVEEVSVKEEHAVEEVSDGAAVPTLLPQEGNAILSDDALAEETEKKDESLNINQSEGLSPQMQTQQQVQSQPSAVTDENDVPMLLPNTQAVEEEAKADDVEKASQPQSSAVTEENDVQMLLSNTLAVEEEVKVDDVEKTSQSQPSAVTDESDVLMLFPEDDIVEGNETEKAPQPQPTASGGESDVPMLLPNTPTVEGEAKVDETGKASQPQPVDDIFSDEAFEDLKLF